MTLLPSNMTAVSQCPTLANDSEQSGIPTILVNSVRDLVHGLRVSVLRTHMPACMHACARARTQTFGFCICVVIYRLVYQKNQRFGTVARASK